MKTFTSIFILALLAGFISACVGVQVAIEPTAITPQPVQVTLGPTVTFTTPAAITPSEETITPVASAPTEAPTTEASPVLPTETAPPTAVATLPRPTFTPIPATATPWPIVFVVSPAEIQPGESLTLTWRVPESAMSGYGFGITLQNATEEMAWLGDSSPNLPLVGSLVITTPSTLNYATDHLDFALSVWSKPPQYAVSILGAVTATVKVSGQPVCDIAWFFDRPPVTCPSQAPLASHAATERFEHGRMIWMETTDVYYIFLDPVGTLKARFIQFGSPLRLKPGASVDNRVGNVPSGLHEPVSGFGLLWRGEVEGAESVRDLLGWAVEPEYGYETLVQCEATFTPHWSCYVRDPLGTLLNFYGLTFEGLFWDVWP